MIKNEISPKHLIFIKLVAKGMKLQDAYRSIVDKEKLTKLTDSSARTMGSRLGKKYAKEIIAAQKVDVEVIESTARIEKAREVYTNLKKEIPQIVWDDNGNIGKRYRRQDEIGTPWCITIDFDTLGENPEHKDTVTIRDRDTGEQTRMAIADLASFMKSKISTSPVL